VLTFLILGITVIWCHSCTKLTSIGEMHNRFTYKLFILLYTFLSTLLLILHPSQVASDNPTNDFVNNLFNSSGGGSNDSDSWF
jgi:dolichyl-phosphate-mannose--protein O-mannosyl transferase